MNNNNYEEKKKRELAYYKSKEKRTLISKLLHIPIFYDSKRDFYNYNFLKEQMVKLINNHLEKKKVKNLLIAPCGTGIDYKYLSRFAYSIYGIDLSPIAIKKCPNEMIIKVGDILKSGYSEEMFDLIASPLFFHHILKFGFDGFLKEFYRILKSGGKLIILEPSVFYPVNAITRPIKKIFHNPFDEVEDEGAFRPKLMIDALKRNNFINLEMQAASFSHVSFFIPLSKIINKITKPLLDRWPFKIFAWYILYWAEKSM
ncbi:MAG: class I SAM-dependent methyltransferase [Promethearchaeota archaeon]